MCDYTHVFQKVEEDVLPRVKSQTMMENAPSPPPWNTAGKVQRKRAIEFGDPAVDNEIIREKEREKKKRATKGVYCSTAADAQEVLKERNHNKTKPRGRSQWGIP